MSENSVNVGIDVSKDTLDIAVSNGERFGAANDEEGIAAVVERLRSLAPERIVLEATGGYEQAVAGDNGQSATGAGFCQGPGTSGQDRPD